MLVPGESCKETRFGLRCGEPFWSLLTPPSATSGPHQTDPPLSRSVDIPPGRFSPTHTLTAE